MAAAIDATFMLPLPPGLQKLRALNRIAGLSFAKALILLLFLEMIVWYCRNPRRSRRKEEFIVV